MIYITFDNNTLETVIEIDDDDPLFHEWESNQSKYVDLAKTWSQGHSTPMIDLFTVAFDSMEVINKFTGRLLVAVISWSQPGFPKSEGLDAQMDVCRDRANAVRRTNTNIVFSFVPPSGHGDIPTGTFFDSLMDACDRNGYRAVL